MESQQPNNVRAEVPANERVPLREKIFYGMGGLMDGGGVALMSCVLLNYMTNSLGIAATVASTIMMASKAWDAVSDPLMGAISDNTRSKYGRRKPYMFFGGILIVVALCLLFLPLNRFDISTGGKVAYMLVMYLFYNTISTITQVPYTSMSSDISPNFKERNNANTVKLIFTSAAAGIAYLVPLLFLEAYSDGKITDVAFWLAIFITFGILFGGGLVMTAIFVKERAPIPKERVKFTFKGYLKPFKMKSFKWHIVMYASAFMCMDILSALAVYYATDVWGSEPLFGMQFSSMFIVAPLMVAAVLAFPMTRIVIDKKSKQFAFRMGLPFYILGGVLLAVLDPEWAPPILIPIVAFIMGFGFGGAQMMPWIIFPDTVDIAELKLGYRPTGNCSGLMTLIRKLAGAFGVWVVGIVLDIGGYQEHTSAEQVGQPDSALLTIRLLMGISIAILISVALWASFRYKVTNQKLTRVKYFLDHMHNGTLDQLSEEEQKEKEALIDELA